MDMTTKKKDRQTEIIKRVEEICNEFDIRVNSAGVNIARLELAKALATCEEGCICEFMAEDGHFCTHIGDVVQ